MKTTITTGTGQTHSVETLDTKSMKLEDARRYLEALSAATAYAGRIYDLTISVQRRNLGHAAARRRAVADSLRVIRSEYRRINAEFVQYAGARF